jgi:hypothetical protein
MPPPNGNPQSPKNSFLINLYVVHITLTGFEAMIDGLKMIDKVGPLSIEEIIGKIRTHLATRKGVIDENIEQFYQEMDANTNRYKAKNKNPSVYKNVLERFGQLKSKYEAMSEALESYLGLMGKTDDVGELPSPEIFLESASDLITSLYKLDQDYPDLLSKDDKSIIVELRAFEVEKSPVIKPILGLE